MFLKEFLKSSKKEFNFVSEEKFLDPQSRLTDTNKQKALLHFSKLSHTYTHM